MKGKIYTRAEANRMLPLLRRITADIRGCVRLAARHRAAHHWARRDGELTDDARAQRLRELEGKLAQLDRRLNSCRAELGELGCTLVDDEAGMVQFYGEREARIVYFTWQPGESEVSYWHPMEQSSRDRQHLDGDERVAENAR